MHLHPNNVADSNRNSRLSRLSRQSTNRSRLETNQPLSVKKLPHFNSPEACNASAIRYVSSFKLMFLKLKNLYLDVHQLVTLPHHNLCRLLNSVTLTKLNFLEFIFLRHFPLRHMSSTSLLLLNGERFNNQSSINQTINKINQSISWSTMQDNVN